MDIERQTKVAGMPDLEREQALLDEEAENLDPSESTLLRDQLNGHTTEHAIPPRLEDEGQSGG